MFIFFLNIYDTNYYEIILIIHANTNTIFIFLIIDKISFTTISTP